MATRDIYERTFDEDVPLPPDRDHCPECGGDLETADGETYCTGCGLVVAEDHLDRGPEWYAEDGEDHQSRVGPPLTPARHDRGLTTKIGLQYDGTGKRLPWRKRRRLDRLRFEHERSKRDSTRERNLVAGFVEVRRLVAALDLPFAVRDRACRILETAQGEDLFHGRSIEAMATASVYAACRCLGLPRTVEEFEAYAQCSESRLRNAYRVLNLELRLPTKLLGPGEYLPRFASALSVSPEVRWEATKLVEAAENAGLVAGRHPGGVGAAALYVAATRRGQPVTQRELLDLAHVSDPTLRARVSELRDLDVSEESDE